MLRISDRRSARGFTLVELMVAVSAMTIVFAGIFAAYLFVGRNLTRLVNFQQQEVQSRRALREFTQDLSGAVNLTTATSTQIALTKSTGPGTTPVTYAYSAANGTLTRTDSSGTRTLLSGVTTFTLSYYNESGSATTSTQSVKGVEFSYSSAAGTSASGTRANYTTVSPRIVLRNKPALQ
jgi:prepilin-type N-terminal cleavage/methylation domain-containing protein